MPKRSHKTPGQMDCKELFALLSEYVDNELNPATCAEIEGHLRGCQPCIGFLNTLRKTAELCRKYKPAELPRPLEAKVRRELREVYEAGLKITRRR